MRKGCYGLCGIVQNELKKNILLGDAFVFINKGYNKIKLLRWDKDGFALYEKRLEKGRFEYPAKQHTPRGHWPQKLFVRRQS